jgi:uncharacterized RDD family membrane protein YckC
LADFVLSEHAAAPAMSESVSSAATSARRSSPGAARVELPLFGGGNGRDDMPLVTPPAVPRTPLSVRRGQPAIARPRPAPGLANDAVDIGARSVIRIEEGRVGGASLARESTPGATMPVALASAPVPARALAGVIDLLVLGAIDAAILLLTLRVLELPMAGVLSLPPVPLGMFLLLLNGGYLAVFTAAGGQTIGKMLTRIKVVAERPAEDPESFSAALRVPLGAAVLRSTAYLVSLLPAGLGFAAILFDADGRALHDRLAETRVVKA